MTIDWRFAEGQPERLPRLAVDLIAQKVDVIVAVTSPAALAAKQATRTIPIVFAVVSDPVALGLVAGLARPGANLTGTAELQAELTGKRFEIFSEAVPLLRSVVLLAGRRTPTSGVHSNASQIAARRLGLEFRVVEVQDPIELNTTFGTEGPRALS